MTGAKPVYARMGDVTGDVSLSPDDDDSVLLRGCACVDDGMSIHLLVGITAALSCEASCEAAPAPGTKNFGRLLLCTAAAGAGAGTALAPRETFGEMVDLPGRKTALGSSLRCLAALHRGILATSKVRPDMRSS